MTYLIGLVFYGAIAYDKVENFYIPYEETDIERKTKLNKERYIHCYSRLLYK
jgi:hypothetical protein